MSTTIERIVGPVIETTEILTELPFEEAQSLTAQLRESLYGASKLYIYAWQHQVWKTLGYDSWDAYLDGEFGDLRVALPRKDRAEAVIEMTQAGMPTRAIASSTGMSKSSVHREVKKAQAGHRLPDEMTITGEDGKVRTSKKKKPVTVEIQEDMLDLPVEDLGIKHFSSISSPQKSACSEAAQKSKERPSPTGQGDYGLEQVEAAAEQVEEAIKASILSAKKQKFDPGTVSHQLVTTTARALLAAAGIIDRFNLQPDLTGENEEIVSILESSAATIDTVLMGLRGAEYAG